MSEGWSAAQVIRWILGAQLGIAALLFGSDLARVLPSLGAATQAPRLTQPIAPGDQTRRYDRDFTPRGPQAPDAADMPQRLLFEAAEDALRLTGAIAEGDAARFQEWLTQHPPPKTVRLHSTGGSVQDALAIGRQLRQSGTATEVAEDQVCFSACPYILAAGTARRVHAGAFVGVHQHYFGENTALPAFLAVEDIQRGQGEVMAYLIDMELDPGLMRHALVTPPDAIYVFVPEELTRYRLATEIMP